MKASKVILVNPAMSTIGYSFITPRWLFLIAQATPPELVGDPVIIDETLERFDPGTVNPGDIVGIGISSGNCLAGYRVLKEAKLRGACVVVGGIHATIFPDEPLEMGADAVVTGNGDVIWSRIVEDALNNDLKKLYAGGRIPGDAMEKARWALLAPRKYMIASVPNVTGWPDTCSFCAVWVPDGRQPRQRVTDRIIEEANELYLMGFRYIIFADDNFNPATLGRIAREPNRQKRRDLERLREERLRFFDEYDRSVPNNLFAFTQMTAEVTSDPEYLSAMYHKMRIRTALVGVESFSQEGLESANKQWNPAGEAMVDTIQRIQETGILVLSSIICGLESDTVQTIRTMSRFARESGTILAQFTIYSTYPGTKDYHEMVRDRNNRGKPGFVPKHRTQLVYDRHWLSPKKPVYLIQHANMSSDELLAENKKCWDSFYSLGEILRRVRTGPAESWPIAGKVAYVCLCIVFKRVYAGHGVSADNVQRKRGIVTKALIKFGVAVYSYFFRQRRIEMAVPVIAPAAVDKHTAPLGSGSMGDPA